MKKYLSTIFDSAVPVYTGISSRLLGPKALPPLIVQLDLTYRCNLHCTMCFQKEKRLSINKGEELRLDEIEKIVRHVPGYSVVTLTGGEPFVRSDIIEICEAVLEKHQCNIITNGTMINEDQTSFLIKKGMTLVGVSIDGTETVHDAIRGVRGSFLKTTGFIRELQERKRKLKKSSPMVDIKTVIMRDNIDLLPEIHALSSGLEADFLTLSIEYGSYNTFSDKEVQLLTRSIEKIRSIKKGPKLRMYPFGLINNDYLTKFLSGAFTTSSFCACTYPWMSMHIDPYGNIYPCQPFFTESLRAAEYNISALWNNVSYLNFRKSLLKNGLFPDCLESCCYLKVKKQKPVY